VEKAGDWGWEIVHASFAHVAQLAEHVLGKDEVTSSTLVMGSRFWRAANKNADAPAT
jgi:hypothetical protein